MGIAAKSITAPFHLAEQSKIAKLQTTNIAVWTQSPCTSKPSPRRWRLVSAIVTQPLLSATGHRNEERGIKTKGGGLIT